MEGEEGRITPQDPFNPDPLGLEEEMENDNVSTIPKKLVTYPESPNLSPIAISSTNVHDLAT